MSGATYPGRDPLSSNTTRWWWIRHAPVPSDGRIYGQGDRDCDCSDRGLFRALAETLPADAIWLSSHLKRTHQTAAAIWAERDHGAAAPQLVQDPDLAEQNFGDWQGLSVDEIGRLRGDAWHRFWLAPAHEAAPNGESFQQVVERTARAIERHSEAHGEHDIICVAHGGTIRAALALALGLEPERALAFSVANCSLTRIDRIAGPLGSHSPEPAVVWRVDRVNALAATPAPVR